MQKAYEDSAGSDMSILWRQLKLEDDLI